SFSFQDLLNLATEQQISNIEAIQTSISPDSGAYLLLTSGSTGQPKAALLSHFAIVNNAIHSAYRNELDRKDHRICLHVPMFHAYGLVNGLFSALNYGSTIVVPSAAFKGSDSLKAIINEKCTVVYGTPTMFVDILAEIRKQKVKSPPMDLAIVGAASCSSQLQLNIQNTLGIRCVRTSYGMTETTGVAFLCDRGNKTESSLDTVGRIMDHYEAKVVDSEGKIVSFGMAGELLIRGYGIMLGYWSDDLKTKQILGNDGWLRTGDQFVLQPDGYGQIVGRIKEIIIRGGENIYPKEVEDVLNSIPEILESYCIGVPDERLGEEVCAYVRLVDMVECSQFDIARMKLFCQDKLAYFKIPKYLRIVEEMSKTSTGKIQKMVLLKMFLSENK
ncbi:medium-chain acyl-CoA ligase ACSF2, mitochondrial-like, partial [Culex pipiens pallens]|uniref:medium-chain acyl-CoA ligase ACSF2, mitochondrial-like n=1 Tax=Culex pipiens pallens TaxID=42434 RepID=UPI0022AB20D1